MGYPSASVIEATVSLRKQKRKERPISTIPRPGRPVRGSTTGKPIMALLDLLGRRWALRIIWELRDGPLTFRDLQTQCDGMSSSVLNQRLAEQRAAGIIEQNPTGYRLTTEGVELLVTCSALQTWADRWAKREQRLAKPHDQPGQPM
jgi:DNA-binding HxlR family transcriptional regulator